MSTQVKRRRGTAAENAAFTGAVGEIVAITDTKKLALHDGTTAGGMDIPNAKDSQNQTYNVGTVGGTADAITLTVAPAITAYANTQKFTFKATGTNTGAVTVAVSGLAAKNVQMVKLGALAALVAGDIISGVWYDIIYDGTQFQLQTSGSGVSQASTGEVGSESAVTKYISPDRLRYAPSVAKCWAFCTLQTSGSIVLTLNKGYNVSSITRSGGIPIINFTNAMADVNYAVSVLEEAGGSGYGTSTKNTGNFQIAGTFSTSKNISFIAFD